MLLQVRIFNYNGDHSREIYHTKRMQRFVPINYFHSSLLCSQVLFYPGLEVYYFCGTIDYHPQACYATGYQADRFMSRSV